MNHPPTSAMTLKWGNTSSAGIMPISPSAYPQIMGA